MSTLPKISVITVVRNSCNTIGKAMESALTQDYPALEYIVLDGGSTDGTADIIRAQAHRLAYWQSAPDGGATAAYNTGINRATGDIIAFLNADDWYEPGIIQRIGEAFRDDPSLDMVTCEARVWKMNAGGEMQLTRTYSGNSLAVTPAASPVINARFIRKEVFERYGNFLVTNASGQKLMANDLEFLLRLSQHPVRNRILPVPGYNYLSHAGSMTFSKNPAHEERMYRERAEMARTYLASPALSPYRARLARWHRRGTTRMFCRAMLARDYTQARGLLSEGMKISGVLWLLDAARVGIFRKYRM